MGTIVERDGRYLARIIRVGAPRLNKTFGSRDEAERWMGHLDHTITERLSLGLPITLADLDLSVKFNLPEQRAHRTTDFRAKRGVYFLFQGSECVYIGQSQDIPLRIAEHRQEGTKQFSMYTWMPVEPGDLDMTEMMLITAIRPKFNVVGMARIATVLLREDSTISEVAGTASEFP